MFLINKNKFEWQIISILLFALVCNCNACINNETGYITHLMYYNTNLYYNTLTCIYINGGITVFEATVHVRIGRFHIYAIMTKMSIKFIEKNGTFHLFVNKFI